ncbi:MAG: outer membrane beta-barrel protein [Gemmatimonadales bacterium]
MMRAFIVLVAASALIGAYRDLAAQRVAVDLRAVGATSTQRLAGADLGLGVGFGMAVGYHLQPHLVAYGGWDWVHFQADRSFAGPDMDFEETGYTAGLRFEHPIGAETLTLFRVEAGATYKHVEVENLGGDIVDDSGHDLGFEAGGGLVLALGESWRFTPTLRFRSLSPTFDILGVAAKSDLRYAGIEVGVSRKF